MTQWGLDTLFNPAKRHMDEEKRRLQATRQQVGDTSGGKRIDLESGKVRIGKGAGEPDETDEAGDNGGETDAVATEQPADAASNEQAEKKAEKPAAKPAGKKAPKPAVRPAAKEPAKKELTPAQIRAAQRRGRQPR